MFFQLAYPPYPWLHQQQERSLKTQLFIRNYELPSSSVARRHSLQLFTENVRFSV